MLLGNWKSFEELEESITIEELNEILTAALEVEEKERRFFAAIQGIDLGDGNKKFDEISARAKDKIKKKDQKTEFSEFGIDFEIGE